jgi:nicotinamide-nucleotide amidase
VPAATATRTLPAVPRACHTPDMTHAAPIVEVVSAGNEVLIGDVLDTNTNWLCVKVTGLGGLVRRTVMLRDDVEAIAAEVRGALDRRPALLFTVGGLGPTADDRTLEGVALGLGVPLELHPEAERLVAEKYRELYAAGHVPFAELTESRRKMARLPAGAAPIVNPIGGAPGVLCRAGDTRVVSLPGVPGELKAIVDGPLEGLLADVFGAAHYEERSLTAQLQDESAIADVLRRAETDHPEVYVKSRAKVFGSGRVLQITVSARAASAEGVDGLLAAAAEQLLREIAAAGYAVAPSPAGPS